MNMIVQQWSSRNAEWEKIGWEIVFPFSIMFSPVKDDEPTSEAIKSCVVKNMASHMDFW